MKDNTAFTPEGDRLVFLTNPLDLGPTTVARIYKDRWQIELLLKYLQLKATFGWSLSNLVALLRMNLFVYRDLWAWLADPFTGPPAPEGPVQGVLIL